MERSPSSPEYRPRRETFLEQYFSLESETFERNTGLRTQELSRLSFSPEQNRFIQVTEYEPRRGLEVLWNSETSTLIVPPPSTGVASIKDLATMAVPVVGFIEQQQPDVIVGCDRGARIYSLAVHSMWDRMKTDEQRFPTLDGRLRFARLSTSLGLDITSEALARVIEESVAEAKRQGRGINGRRLKLMFIDDWISSGATRRQIMASLKDIGVMDKSDVVFAVMCGEGADATGSRRRVSVPWQDNPEVIGVNYTRDGIPFAVRTEAARKVRRRLHRATKELATKLI